MSDINNNQDPRILKGQAAIDKYNEIKEKNLLLFETIVGSHSYGLNIETSDIDKTFVYIEPIENILNGTYSIQINITDDYKGYELGRFLDLIQKNNPNILEQLFEKEEFIQYCHPLFKELIISNNNSFISKQVAFSFGSYAKNQIDKAQGTNKKFMNPMDGPRKSILEFAYVPYKQGSISLKKYLEKENIPSKFIGLSSIEHMKYTYHLFIDPKINKLQKELIHKFINKFNLKYLFKSQKYKLNKFNEYYSQNFEKEIENFISIYNGPIDIDGVQPKMSSIPKNENPEIQVQFNLDGFQKYCKDYKEYHEWLEKRNIARFVENATSENNFDRKNLFHCHRLLNMCIEILSGEGVKVFRNDKDELLKIRLGNHSYQELVDSANIKLDKIKELYKISTLPEKCDKNLINNLILQFRKEFYKI